MDNVTLKIEVASSIPDSFLVDEIGRNFSSIVIFSKDVRYRI